MTLFVFPCEKSDAATVVKREHYLHRVPPISFAYQLADAEMFGRTLGIVTFGVPASPNLMVSACKTKPERVIELNRLWCSDECPRNTESWFVSRALKMLPPYVVVSFADTSVGHQGYVYRAMNFRYAGLTDADRKTPRFDYVTPGKHPRDTSRNGTMATAERVRRQPKHRYWTVTGSRRECRALLGLVTWPSLDWRAA